MQIGISSFSDSILEDLEDLGLGRVKAGLNDVTGDGDDKEEIGDKGGGNRDVNIAGSDDGI